MLQRTSRQHLLIALISVLAILAGACSSDTNGKGRTEAGPDGSITNQVDKSSGRIPVYVYNPTNQTVSLNVGTKDSSSTCLADKWEYKGRDMETGALDPLAPRSTLEGLFIISSSCKNDIRPPYYILDAFTFGVVGGAQFKFDVNYTWNTRGGDLIFGSVTWTTMKHTSKAYAGNYTGGGDTKGLVMYNAGNNGILGSGNPGINNDFTYVRDQQIYFTFCPEVAGKKSVAGSAIPNNCRKP